MHVNAATVGFIPFGEVDEATLAEFTDAEMTRFERMNRYLSEGNAYFQIQSTARRPSPTGWTHPAGQLAWIVEKFKEWTHPRPSCRRRQ